MEKIKQYWKEIAILVLAGILINISINSIFKKDKLETKTEEQIALEGFQHYLEILDRKKQIYDSTKADLENFESVLKNKEVVLQTDVVELKKKKTKMNINAKKHNIPIDTVKLNELIRKYSSSKN